MTSARFVPQKEIALRARCSREAVRYAINAGNLPVVVVDGIRRVTVDDAEHWIANRGQLVRPRPDMLTMDEVAAAARRSSFPIWSAVTVGKLPATRIGRRIWIADADAARWLASRRAT